MVEDRGVQASLYSKNADEGWVQVDAENEAAEPVHNKEQYAFDAKSDCRSGSNE